MMVSTAQEVHIPLNEGWSFRQVGTEQWYPAQVPGVLQQDLLRNGLIPDPMHNANADSVQWIELKDWEYRCTLQADGTMLKHGHLDLVFKGLDTFAEVYLNDSLLGKADNMFRSWEWPVNALLKPGANELKVIFRSPILEGAKLREAYGLQLPHDSDPSGVSPYIRKAAYQFGWDFAPRLVTCGIWQEVELRGWSNARINAFEVFAEPKDKDLNLSIITYADWSGAGHVRFKLDGRTFHRMRMVPKAKWGMAGFDGNVKLPDLWWPAGEGERPIHTITAELINAKGQVIHRVDKRTGFRSVELIREEQGTGTSFKFRINGKEVFMRGCNVVPPNLVQTPTGDSVWVALVAAMSRANMNMTRLWAGGVYPPEAFYDACDNAGILVWQDFMMGNLIPASQDFLNNLWFEGSEFIERACQHPSLAVMCGDNELEVAWQNWGWQERYTLHGNDSVRVSNGYADALELLAKPAEGRRIPYTPTSPLSNWGNAEGLKNGDLHYWGVWHGDSAFSSFKNNAGRFVSEYGFQSYPDSATLATQLDPEHLYLGSPMLAKRQKSYKTDKPIWTAIEREFAVKPRYLGEFILFSQLAQAEAYRQAIWAHVTNQPHCMGTLFWQLNDVWAGPSWSTVDHTGTWKAAMYEVARSYKPVVLDMDLANGKVTATLWNERIDLKMTAVVTEVYRTDGQRIRSDTSLVALAFGKSEVLSVGQEALLQGGGADRHVIRVAVLNDRGEVLAERILPFRRMGEMAWEKAEVRLEHVGGSEGSTTYRVSTDKPVPVVKLEAAGAEFSDNYFPLVPGADRLITVTWRGRKDGEPMLSVWPKP